MKTTATKARTKIAWAPVRIAEDDGHEWIDIACIGLVRDECIQKVNVLKKGIAGWDKANPVNRYVQVRIEEM